MKVEVDLKGDKELIAALKKTGANVDGILVQAVVAGASVIQGAANAKAPGPHIEINAHPKRRGKIRVDIGPDKDHWYYMFFETGATPHRIGPKNRKMLRFYEGGEPVFAHAVSHPGMPARPYLRPALDEREGDAVDAVGRVIRRVLPR